MIRSVFITLILCLNLQGHCQVNSGSLAGSYVFKSWTGGGFTGGPNGSCISLPPDSKITNKITILWNLKVIKTSDTILYTGHVRIDWNCDTLYIGKAELVADTLTVTYTTKPLCTGQFYISKSEKRKRYETLKQTIVEKFILQREDGIVQGLRRWEDEGVVYDKERPEDAKP